MEPSDLVLGLLLAFSRLVDCSLLQTRHKVTDFKICIKYLCVNLFGVIRLWHWPGVYMSPCSFALNHAVLSWGNPSTKVPGNPKYVNQSWCNFNRSKRGFSLLKQSQISRSIL